MGKKSLLFACTILFFFAAESLFAGIPTNRKHIRAPLVSHQDAQRVLSNRLIEEFRAGEETEITPEIQALAHGLRHDPKLIYEHVRNNIDYVPLYGSTKSATATLLDGCGNDFDQTSLLIALLRESGYTAVYIYGVVRINANNIVSWLGVDNDADVVGMTIASGGIPATVYVYPNGNLAYVDMDHVWAKVNIGGTDYVFDPSFKGYDYPGGIDLATAMGYDQTTFLANATSGATVDPDYVQNINRTNIHADLTTYSSNLVDELNNLNGATLEEVIDGRTIAEKRDQAFVTTLPYEQARLHEWTDVPSSYQTFLRFQHLGIDENLPVPLICGKRFTLTYNTSNAPELRLDGTLLATGNPTSPGSYNSITLSVDHAYAAAGGAYGDQSHSTSLLEGGTYVIVNGWGGTGPKVVDKHKRILAEYVEAGQASDSEPVLGESLSAIAHTWLSEVTLSELIGDSVGNTLTLPHHTVGYCGQTLSPYVDLPMSLVSVISKSGIEEEESATFFSSSGISSAFEWGAIDQSQPISAVCTVKLIDISSAKSDKVFNATPSNYYSTIKPQLVNYSNWEYASVEAYINAGYRVVLPQDGDLNEKDWTGIGFIAVSPGDNSIGHIISGSLSGGFGSEIWDLDPGDLLELGQDGLDALRDLILSYEPIDLYSGSYIYEHTDLRLGNGNFPFALEFKRSYRSASKGNDGVLGRGWNHNWNYSAGIDTDGFKGLGEESAMDAVPAIVELFIAHDLLKGSKSIDRLVIATLSHRWFMDRLIENIVFVQEGGSSRRFLKLPDGTYIPPSGDASKLTEEPDGSYLIDEPHGSSLDFDTDGKLAAMTDRNGNMVSLSYVGDKLDTITNNMGRTLTLTYTTDRLSQVSDSAGRDVYYYYDADNNLVTFTDAEAFDTTYTYDIPGRMEEIFYPAFPSDPFVTNVYDDYDRVITQTDGEGNTYHYYYSGARTEEENPLGDSMAWYFDGSGRKLVEIDALGHETLYEYDGYGRLVLETFSEENRTAYEYDQNHNNTRITRHPKPGSGEPPIAYVYTFEATHNLVETQTDPLGNTTTYTYDGNGNLLNITQPEVDGQIPEFDFTYNSRGQVETETDPESLVREHYYDVVNGDLLAIIVDPSGLALQTDMVFDAVGNMTQKTDTRGNTATFVYNDKRQLTQSILPPTFSYVTNYYYDGNGNMIKTEKETGIPATPWQTIDFTYSFTNNRETMTGPDGKVTSFEYDLMDRLWKVIDAELNVTRYLYDEVGRLYQVIGADGLTSEEHLYSPNGKKLSFEDANGNVTQYVYDDFDWLGRMIYPDTSFEEFQYDAAGNIESKRLRSGAEITYTYDPLNRLETKAVPPPNGDSIQLVYDLTGRVEDVIYNEGMIHHGYDSVGRLTSVMDQNGRTVQYEYDSGDNRTKVVYPDGYFVEYVYDELNRMTDALENGTVLLASYSYDPLGRRIDLTYGNGASTTYIHELNNDLTAVDHQFTSSTLSFAYTYDDVGNVETRTDSLGATTFGYDLLYQLIDVVAPSTNIDYNLDAAGNRISVIKDSTTTSYAVNNLNQYTSVGGVGYDYDANGNLTWNGKHLFLYDQQNRMVNAFDQNQRYKYTYDPFERRTSKKVFVQSFTQIPGGGDGDGRDAPPQAGGPSSNGPLPGGPMQPKALEVIEHASFVYDGDQVIMEYDELASQYVRRYVYGPNVDEPIAMLSGGDIHYYHFDGIDSVAALSDSAGEMAESYSYSPYGAVDSPGAVGNPYLHKGRRLDLETGLYYNRSRHYDPETGRFLQPDPISYTGGINLYTYCYNNPYSYRDPSGRFPLAITAAIGAVGGAIIGGATYAIFHDGDWSWGQFAGSVAGGAVTGAIGGATLGLGLGVAGSIGLGMGTGAVGYGTELGVSKGLTALFGEDVMGQAKEFNPIEAAGSVIVGGLGALVPNNISHVPGAWPKYLKTWVFGAHGKALWKDWGSAWLQALAYETGKVGGKYLSDWLAAGK
ncbi:MAG: RHS repeat-associated core domain-containing protein [Planctomycetota bacterium]|jgi:RHS repeat-associated protein